MSAINCTSLEQQKQSRRALYSMGVGGCNGSLSQRGEGKEGRPFGRNCTHVGAPSRGRTHTLLQFLKLVSSSDIFPAGFARCTKVVQLRGEDLQVEEEPTNGLVKVAGFGFVRSCV